MCLVSYLLTRIQSWRLGDGDEAEGSGYYDSGFGVVDEASLGDRWVDGSQVGKTVN